MSGPGGKQQWDPWLIQDRGGDYAWGVRVGEGTVASGMSRTVEGALRCPIQAVLSNTPRFMAPIDRATGNTRKSGEP